MGAARRTFIRSKTGILSPKLSLDFEYSLEDILMIPRNLLGMKSDKSAADVHCTFPLIGNCV